jgi:peptidyl-prolyl cis-trans isomerase A (cyclophilin A)
MNRSFPLALSACALLTVLAAVQAPAQGAAPKPAPATTSVVLQTTLGEIRIALDTVRAPITSRNFLAYVDSGRFDGTTFYRALKHDRDGTQGLVQGGLRGRSRRALPPIAHESTVTTGLAHLDGAVSMAREEPGSARGEFFITIGDMRYFDAVPDGGDPGFAVFGRVTSGMSIVRRIMRMPRTADGGGLAMQGQMLAEPVAIVTARRAPAP